MKNARSAPSGRASRPVGRFPWGKTRTNYRQFSAPTATARPARSRWVGLKCPVRCAILPGDPRRGRAIRHYLIALSLGIVASLLWSSSFVLIKVGLDYADPLTLGGLRYFGAFLLLAPLLVRRLPPIRGGGRVWIGLIGMAILAYPISNGLFYWGLQIVSPTTAAFLYNFTPLFVLILGMLSLREFPTRIQWAGFWIVAVGSYVFFAAPIPTDAPIGVGIIIVSAIAYSGFSVITRHFAKDRRAGTLALTAVPLGLGGAIMLGIAAVVETPPRLTWELAGIALWLAIVNSAIANSLWNHALIRLKAFELNILFGVMPIETALIEWAFRGNPPTALQIVGMFVAIVGVLIVQFAHRLSRTNAA